MGGGAPTLGAFVLPLALAFLAASCLPVALALVIALTLSPDPIRFLMF